MISGQVFEYVESEVAGVLVTDDVGKKIVEVQIGGVTKISFPLREPVDLNEIELRTANVINQTGFVDKLACVKLTETP